MYTYIHIHTHALGTHTHTHTQIQTEQIDQLLRANIQTHAAFVYKCGKDVTAYDVLSIESKERWNSLSESDGCIKSPVC